MSLAEIDAAEREALLDAKGCRCDQCDAIKRLASMARKAEERTFPHFCQDGHVPIGYADSGDDERCPVCQQRDRAEAVEAQLVKATMQYDNVVNKLESAEASVRELEADLREVRRGGMTFEEAT